MLAKKKSGMKGIISRKRIALSAAKARIGEDPHLDQRVLDPQLVEDEGGEDRDPAAMQIQVIGLPQPQTLDCCRPSMARPMPPQTSAAPR